MSELFNVFKAMEYNDREETLYSIIRNVKKANIFQEKAVQIERPRYYHVGDKRQLLIEHRNEHLNTVYHELKKLNDISLFVNKKKLFELPALELRPYQEDCNDLMQCIMSFISMAKAVKQDQEKAKAI